MKIEEQVEKLNTLITEIRVLDEAQTVAGNCNSSYARINITNNGSNTTYLHNILTLDELIEIANYIHDKLLEKKLRLEDELNSYIISKQL